VSGLRPYQEEAIASTKQVLDEASSALLVMATGSGKTYTCAKLCEELRPRYGRVLWLAHRGELLEQARGTFAERTRLSCEIEQAERRVSRLLMPDVVCASVQSMQGARLQEFDPRTFGVVVVDEAHHAPAAGHRAVLGHFAEAKRVGLTATPDRMDKQALGQVFERVAYVYDIRDAIRDGHLAPIRAVAVDVEGLDLSGLSKSQGDFSVTELEQIMSEEKHLHEVAQPTLELAADRPTIVFAVTVEHAKLLTAVFERYRPGCARSVDGNMDLEARRELRRQFEQGDFQFLINVMLLTEGVDLPWVSAVAMARPTMSRPLYSQMVGRSTRLFPGKKDALVIDFVGVTGRHSLVTAVDILGGDETEEVRGLAKRLAKEDPQLELLDAIDQARTQIAELERRKRATARARYQAREVDLFATESALLGIDIRAADGPVEMPPTREQLEKLAKHKIPTTGLDYWEAQKICRAVRERAMKRLCTLNQARFIRRFGIRTDLSFEQASKAMDILAACKWKPTAEVVKVLQGWVPEPDGATERAS
jgi:superfamily II DNA or RNA helicase